MFACCEVREPDRYQYPTDEEILSKPLEKKIPKPEVRYNVDGSVTVVGKETDHVAMPKASDSVKETMAMLANIDVKQGDRQKSPEDNERSVSDSESGSDSIPDYESGSVSNSQSRMNGDEGKYANDSEINSPTLAIKPPTSNKIKRAHQNARKSANKKGGSNEVPGSSQQNGLHDITESSPRVPGAGDGEGGAKKVKMGNLFKKMNKNLIQKIVKHDKGSERKSSDFTVPDEYFTKLIEDRKLIKWKRYEPLTFIDREKRIEYKKVKKYIAFETGLYNSKLAVWIDKAVNITDAAKNLAFGTEFSVVVLAIDPEGSTGATKKILARKKTKTLDKPSWQHPMFLLIGLPTPKILLRIEIWRGGWKYLVGTVDLRLHQTPFGISAYNEPIAPPSKSAPKRWLRSTIEVQEDDPGYLKFGVFYEPGPMAERNRLAMQLRLAQKKSKLRRAYYLLGHKSTWELKIFNNGTTTLLFEIDDFLRVGRLVIGKCTTIGEGKIKIFPVLKGWSYDDKNLGYVKREEVEGRLPDVEHFYIEEHRARLIKLEKKKRKNKRMVLAGFKSYDSAQESDDEEEHYNSTTLIVELEILKYDLKGIFNLHQKTIRGSGTKTKWCENDDDNVRFIFKLLKAPEGAWDMIDDEEKEKDESEEEEHLSEEHEESEEESEEEKEEENAVNHHIDDDTLDYSSD